MTLPRAPYRPTWTDIDRTATAAASHRARLLELLAEFASGGLLVAFSGGVDSSYLLHEARQCVPNLVAGIAVSESLGESELARARTFATDLGVRLVEVPTREIELPEYRRNAPDRCYFCKKTLFAELGPLAQPLWARTA